MTQRSIEAEIGLCLLFSAVDGEISEIELASLSDRVGRLLGDDFDPMALPELVEGEMTAISDQGVDDYVAGLPARIHEARRFEAVRAACVVACADGLAPEEDEVVRQVCRALSLDPDDVIDAASVRIDTIGAASDAHDDEPNEVTRAIAAQLAESGWVDPMQTLRDAGITVSGFGALALEYQAPSGQLLRLEHHTCDGSVHLHVTDDAEVGSELVLFASAGETRLISTIVGMQEAVTPANIEQHIKDLLGVAKVCIFQGASLVEVEGPA